MRAQKHGAECPHRPSRHVHRRSAYPRRNADAVRRPRHGYRAPTRSDRIGSLAGRTRRSQRWSLKGRDVDIVIRVGFDPSPVTMDGRVVRWGKWSPAEVLGVAIEWMLLPFASSSSRAADGTRTKTGAGVVLSVRPAGSDVAGFGMQMREGFRPLTQADLEEAVDAYRDYLR
jgi:hypothetical protein